MLNAEKAVVSLLIVVLLGTLATASAADPSALTVKPGGVLWTDGERSILFSGSGGDHVNLWVRGEGCGYPVSLPIRSGRPLPEVQGTVLVYGDAVPIRAVLDRETGTIVRARR